MSMKNCLYDKALHATVKECKCRPSFYVLRAIYNDVDVCIGKQLDCAFEVFDNVESPKRIHSGSGGIRCQQPCNDQLYDTRYINMFLVLLFRRIYNNYVCIHICVIIIQLNLTE